MFLAMSCDPKTDSCRVAVNFRTRFLKTSGGLQNRLEIVEHLNAKVENKKNHSKVLVFPAGTKCDITGMNMDKPSAILHKNIRLDL